MKKLTIKSKTIRTLGFVFAALLLGSCSNDGKSTSSNGSDAGIQNPTAEEALLVGSWKDASPAALDFTLFENGTARSDNMKTLLYKSWSVNGKQVIFTVESIGNGTSSTSNVTYTIDTLTKSDLVLREGAYLSKYTRE